MAVKRYMLGYWCPVGDGQGHADLLFRDDGGGMCGSKGWPLVIEVDEEDINMLPDWAVIEED